VSNVESVFLGRVYICTSGYKNIVSRVEGEQQKIKKKFKACDTYV
jgi:hypothetical protein